MKFVKKLVKIQNICQVLVILTGLSLGITGIGRTQQNVQNVIENLIPDPYDEWVAGGVGNLFFRGPWIAKSWRKPIPRIVSWSVLSAFYEVALDRSHGNRIDATARQDWLDREIGYLLTESLIAVGKKIF